MTTYALKLTSSRIPGECILPRRFDDWEQASQFARSISNDPFWKQPIFNSRGALGPVGSAFIVEVAGGFLRVVPV